MPPHIPATNPVDAAAQAAALVELRITFSELVGTMSALSVATGAIPSEGSINWLGTASEAFRQEGRNIAARLDPALEGLKSAVMHVEGELY